MGVPDLLGPTETYEDVCLALVVLEGRIGARLGLSGDLREAIIAGIKAGEIAYDDEIDEWRHLYTRCQGWHRDGSSD